MMGIEHPLAPHDMSYFAVRQNLTKEGFRFYPILREYTSTASTCPVLVWFEIRVLNCIGISGEILNLFGESVLVFRASFHLYNILDRMLIVAPDFGMSNL